MSGDAIGASPACSLTGTAAATNSPEFILASNACIVDKICGTSTTAQAELFNVDRATRTGKIINLTTLANTVADRPVEKICMQGGVTYRWIMTIAQS
jgi:hypothetical protein